MVFLFSMGMGTFAFLGRSIISQRSGGKNFLLASPAMQPIDLQTTYLAYYLKEVSFYIVLILTPVTIGMALGIASQSIFEIQLCKITKCQQTTGESELFLKLGFPGR